MHTDTTLHKRHRWFVVLPLLFVIVSLTLREGFAHRGLTGDIASIPADGQVSVAANSSARTILLPNGVLRLEPGTRIDLSDPTQPLLRQGSAMIVTHGLQKIAVNGMTLEGWNGAFHVILDGNSLTVVSLTTPVFAQNVLATTIVPAAMQWKNDATFPPVSSGIDAWLQSRSLKQVPDSYLQQELATVDTVSSAILGIPVSLTDASTPAFMQIVQLPASRARSLSDDRASRLNALAQDLSTGGTTALTAALSSPDATSLLTSDEGKAALPLLLALAETHGKEDLLLPYITHQKDLLLLALYHPLLRDHSWVLTVDAPLDDDTQLSRFAFVPLADDQPHAMSSIAVQRWITGFQTFLTGRKDAADILNAVLPLLSTQVQRFTDQQYPERAARYQQAALTLAQPYAATLSTQGQAALAAVQSLQTPNEQAASSESFGSSSSSSVPALSIPDLERKTHDALVARGFMFTPQTTLHGHTDQTVDVSNAVLGTKAGDSLVSFTYNPVSDEVSNIEKDGSTLPYSITLQQYMEWMTGH